MKANAIAHIGKTALRIVSSFGCEIDVEILSASCFKSVPSQARNGVVVGFVGFERSREKKPLHFGFRQLTATGMSFLAARRMVT
jgi:hypothetical protein